MLDLYDYQQKAISFLKTGSVLCGGVGTGKSITSLYYYVEKVCEGCKDYGNFILLNKPVPLYIITTAKKRDSLEWDKEAESFIKKINTKVIVDSWNNIKKYVDVEDSFFIFDEQKVIGYGAWTKSFLAITKKNKWILLSATPGDTWLDYMPVFIANGYYKNKTEFIKRHVVYSRLSKFPKVERYLDEDILEKIKKDIVVIMEGDKKVEKINTSIHVEHDKELTKMVMKNRFNIYTNEPIKDSTELCHVLRRICNSDNSRIEALDIIYREFKKVIVFYNFNYEREILLDFFKKNNINYGELNGWAHDIIPKKDSWIYIVQYNAGSEGWNCIETNVVVFYSRSYSYKMTHQAAGRIDRVNTPFKHLFYFYLDSSSYIDYAIKHALNQKKNFHEKLFVKKL